MTAAVLMTATGALAAAPSATDRVALEKLAADNDAAWNAKNVAVVSGQYVADASLRLGTSAAHDGREAVRAYFTRAFGARQGNLRHVSKVDNIDMVTPDLAFADAYVRVERDNSDGTVTLMREFRNHSIVVRENGQWRMRAVRAHPLPANPAS